MKPSRLLIQNHLFALSALEGPLPLVLVLPHVVHKVALRHKLLLADVTGIRLLAMVFHPKNNRYLDIHYVD